MPLRELQLLTGMLISGSSVLQFLQRVTYPLSDMDMFVDRDHSLEVIDWLEERGFEVIPLPASPRTLRPRVDPVASLARSLGRWYATLASDDFPATLSMPPPSSVFDSSLRELLPEHLSSADPYSGTAGICRVISLQRDGRVVQVVVMDYNPLEAILTFHSSAF